MSLQSIIDDHQKKALWVGGKGGVGKTSTASALALALAESGRNTLLISTDPAHSISDSLGQDVSGGDIVKVEGIEGNLSALEIDPAKAIEEFKENLDSGSDSMNELKSSMSMLGLDDINETITESIPPGMDEALSLAKAIQYIENDEFDIVVFDTAPTGHTLRLLALPDFLDSFIGKLMKMRVRISNMFSSIRGLFGGSGEKDTSMEVMDKLKESVKNIKEHLQDPYMTEFIIVTIPTLMAVYESKRLLASLNQFNIPIRRIIVNQIVPETIDCKFCLSRRASQLETLEQIEDYFGDFALIRIQQQEDEIRGIESLRNLSRMLLS
ncbi:MAG: ArsA family ATPase [Candidatus Heimdallarchaeota archaeon]|nr:ArsA family ATPase [Candidatus Heimdallarchaeota archaeon]MCK5048898.1 ArsA family ATPase [Candidatus Heimdallarchaeota archaeon]